MSTEARITQLQDQTTSLCEQVSTLREVLETELERMRAAVHGQLADANGAFAAREAASTSRLDRLEAEIGRLAQACERAIRTEELLGAADDAARAASPAATRTPSTHLAPPVADVLSIQNSYAADHAVANSFDDKIDVNHLLPRIERVFDFYTQIHVADAELLQPEMHLHQFTAMVRDSGLERCGRSLPPELLWMAVLRDLPSNNNSVSSRDRSSERRLGSTLLLPRVFDGDVCASSSEGDKTRRGGAFARERLRSISKAQFPRTLYVVFRATSANAREAAVAPDAFNAFLSAHFLPTVEVRIQRRQAAQLSLLNSPGAHRDAHSPPALLSAPPEDASAKAGPSRAASDSPAVPLFASAVARYTADAEAQAALQQFAAPLRRCFRDATRCPRTCRTEEVCMSVDAFVDVARRHHLLPLVSRVQLRDIFAFCLTVTDAPLVRSRGAAAKAAAVETPPAACVGISFAAFASAAVFCLAEVIYGGSPPLREHFPSPSFRVAKLLVKMFVLL